MQITGVAQSCQSGNQAKFTRRGHMSTDQQKNFIGKTISRFGKFPVDYKIMLKTQINPAKTRITRKIMSLNLNQQTLIHQGFQAFRTLIFSCPDVSYPMSLTLALTLTPQL